jgi:hypothetical protein
VFYKVENVKGTVVEVVNPLPYPAGLKTCSFAEMSRSLITPTHVSEM